MNDNCTRLRRLNTENSFSLSEINCGCYTLLPFWGNYYEFLPMCIHVSSYCCATVKRGQWARRDGRCFVLSSKRETLTLRNLACHSSASLSCVSAIPVFCHVMQCDSSKVKALSIKCNLIEGVWELQLNRIPWFKREKQAEENIVMMSSLICKDTPPLGLEKQKCVSPILSNLT